MLTRNLFLLFFCFSAAAQTALPDNDMLYSVVTDETGTTVETRIIIDKQGEQAKITFIQETENGFVFKNINWQGDAKLYLENGKEILLEGTDIKGQNMQPGAYIAGYYVPNRYERFAAFFLSPEECALLKLSPVKRVEYKLDDKFENNVRYLEVSDANQSLRAQIAALGM